MRKKLYGVLMAAAVLSVAAAGIRQANAYFTTYAEAKGGYTIHLGDETTVEEEVVGSEKRVTLTNSSTSSQAVYVRARAFAPNEIKDGLTYNKPASQGVSASEKWSQPTDSDPWCYYSDVLQPGESADVLVVSVTEVPEEAVDGQSFNVVVVYETTPAVQNGDGQYEAADWAQSEDSGWTRNTAEGQS
ncbi:MAG: hypothetical protein IJ860_01200 [Eubacterium sp.]|nr:hypothetical protein [Eubacterium sp.]